MNKRATPEHLKPSEAARVAKWRAENPERHLEVSRQATSKLYDKRQEEKIVAALRDKLAVAALQGLIANPTFTTKGAFHASNCASVWDIADTVLAARK